MSRLWGDWIAASGYEAGCSTTADISVTAVFAGSDPHGSLTVAPERIEVHIAAIRDVSTPSVPLRPPRLVVRGTTSVRSRKGST